MRRPTGTWVGLTLALAACGGVATPPPPAPTVTITRAPERSIAPPAPLAAPATERDDGPLALVQGVFESTIWSSGTLQDAETDLSLTADGGRGSYTFTDEERSIRGDLGLCHRSAERAWTCQWLDEYGTGKVTFLFDADLRRFEGEWWADDEPELKYPWTGARLGTANEEDEDEDEALDPNALP